MHGFRIRCKRCGHSQPKVARVHSLVAPISYSQSSIFDASFFVFDVQFLYQGSLLVLTLHELRIIPSGDNWGSERHRTLKPDSHVGLFDGPKLSNFK